MTFLNDLPLIFLCHFALQIPCDHVSHRQQKKRFYDFYSPLLYRKLGKAFLDYINFEREKNNSNKSHKYQLPDKLKKSLSISEEYEFLKRLTIRLPCGEEGNTECQLQYAYQEEMEMSLENPCKELEKEDMKNLTKMLEDFLKAFLQYPLIKKDAKTGKDESYYREPEPRDGHYPPSGPKIKYQESDSLFSSKKQKKTEWYNTLSITTMENTTGKNTKFLTEEEYNHFKGHYVFKFEEEKK